MSTLALPFTDLARLKRRVTALAENRPAVYRMIDASGKVIYVGKARCLRNRMLSYFRAEYPDKAARILAAATDIAWDPMPSEFAALLGELAQIRRYRPSFNVKMNRRRRIGFIKISSTAAPKIYVGTTIASTDLRSYGPFTSVGRVKDGVRVLNDLLGLRDCALEMPITFAEQGDLFGETKRAGCFRFELGQCVGPCGGLVTEGEYRDRLAQAIGFLETASVEPLDRAIEEMNAASERREFELAARWREKFNTLAWLLAATVRTRSSVRALNFVYTDPGVYGDDRAYIIRNGTVRASTPAPRTPIERVAFQALVAEHAGTEPEKNTLDPEAVDEILLVIRWFRTHPGAWHRTGPLDEWLNEDALMPAAS